jgi:phytoene dehydrogenase-like protein
MNVNLGPEKPQDIEQMWKEIRAGEFPEKNCLHAICPTAFDPLQAPNGKHAASVYMPVPFELKGKRPEDWVRLKNGFMESILKKWRQYATNLTDENITMKVTMDPFYMSGRWPNMRRGSVWIARKIATQMGEQRPVEQIAGYRTPIQGLFQVGVAMHPADAVIAGSGYNCWQVMKEDLKL